MRSSSQLGSSEKWHGWQIPGMRQVYDPAPVRFRRSGQQGPAGRM